MQPFLASFSLAHDCHSYRIKTVPLGIFSYLSAMFTAVSTYINEAIQELELVRWPTRQQAVRLSVIVLAFTLVSSAIFGLVDFLLSQVVRFLLSFVA